MRRYERNFVKKYMHDNGLYFRKNFGQNFLVDKNVVEKICDIAKVSDSSQVLEIGPGIGVMTEEMLLRGANVTAIELDRDLYKNLISDFTDYIDKDKLKVINDDGLKIKLSDLFEENSYKIVANLPYYITTPLITKFLEEKNGPSSITVMVQKEVADRLCCSKNKKLYGAISVFVQYFAEVKTELLVRKGAFMPSPKVDSAVVHFKRYTNQQRYEKYNLDSKEEKLFFSLYKAGFQERRKKLINAINHKLGFDKSELEYIFKKLNIDINVRAENLSVLEYVHLTKNIYNDFLC